MKILIDQALPVADDFARFGTVASFDGRTLGPDLLHGADVLIVRSVTWVDEGLLAGSGVRFVGSPTAGIDHVDTAFLDRRGIAFAHAPGCNARPVAEYVLAAICLMAQKRGLSPLESTLGVVGVGNVGSIVAAWGRMLGLTILQNDPPRQRSGDLGPWTDLDDLLAASDFVTLHVPLTVTGPDPTRNLLDARRLDRMKPGAVLINTARGEVVREAALLAALTADGPIAAVLDVWQHEPRIDPDLVTRVEIATPHVAGYSVEARRRGMATIVNALAKWAGTRLEPPTGVPARGKPGPPSAPIAPVYGGFPDLPAVADALASACGIPKIDADLRASLARADAAGRFDALRAAAAGRREFTAYTLDRASFSPAACEFLTAVGFRISPKN